MRILLSLIFVFIANIAFANLPDIVAFVNDKPITLYELQNRKKMIIALNSIDPVTPELDKQIQKSALDSIINEQIINQNAEKVGNIVKEEQVDAAIESIEEKNKMPKGNIARVLQSKAVYNSFRSQIKAELIKMDILSSVSRSVDVSQKEIEAAILTSSSKDANVTALVFTAKDNSKKAIDGMQGLQKVLQNKSCDQVKSKTANFANREVIDSKLSSLDKQTQIIVQDLKPLQASGVFQTNLGSQILFLCEKKIMDLSDEENEYVTNFLVNKKTSQKAIKYFQDLRKKAYIKIMIPKG